MKIIKTVSGVELQTLRERERAWAAAALATGATCMALCGLCWLVWLACCRWAWLQTVLPPFGFMLMGAAAHSALRGGGGPC